MGGTFQIDEAQFIEQARRQFQLTDRTIAVVKNNAYNYGLEFAVKAFAISGIRAFATTSVDDAVKIRHMCGDKVDIILMNPTTDFKRARMFNLHITLPSRDYYDAYKDELHDIHIHLEYAGLFNRSGLSSIEELEYILNDMNESDLELNFTGLWTHFGYSDEFDGIYETERGMWEQFISDVLELGIKPSIHAQNSASYVRDGLLDKHSHVRLGIGLYGSKPYADLDDKDFVQSSTLSAPIVQFRRLTAGMTLGYGAAFKADEDCTVAVVDIGYGDGVLRARAGHECEIGGKTYPIVALMMSHMVVLVDDDVEAHMSVYLYNKKLRIDKYTHLGVGANSEQLGALNYQSLGREIIYDV
ncbi:alanine racemase [Jeotgalicoccus sp. WY2]|uniref:alanine racemase n=1 Tax=Jeotgalicoccus sp. WY2 TaxID=2708346 RepID=UPI001BD3E97D|nr:alanine racemase [Jeotgalicoccus sp. WY2]